MTRKRMIDPYFWDNPKTGRMTDTERIFVVGCFSNADDDGRLIADPAHLRSIIYKYHNRSLKKVEEIRNKVCGALDDFQLYTINGTDYIQLVSWKKYQLIRQDRYKSSQLPPPVNQPVPKPQPPDNQTGTKVKLSKVKLSKEREQNKHSLSKKDKDIILKNQKNYLEYGIDLKYIQNFFLQCEAKNYKYADFGKALLVWFKKDNPNWEKKKPKYKEADPNCPKCNGTGWMYTKEGSSMMCDCKIIKKGK